MPDPDFTIKQGDTSPAIEAQLLNGDDPIDLSDATVGFRMQHQQDDDVHINGLCAITDETRGRVSYIWNDGDTDTVGRYSGEFVLDYDIPESMGEFDVDETFPSDGFLSIHVTETLDF